MNSNNNIINGYINTNTDKTGYDNISTFYGFNQPIYLDPAIGGFAFIFITKPSLFLYPTKTSDPNKLLAYNNVCIDPTLAQYIEGETTNTNDVYLLKQLSYFDFPASSSLFIPMFTNLTKSFTPNDTNMNIDSNYTTKEGLSYQLPTYKTQSDGAGSVNISISETGNYDILKTIRLINNYIAKVTDGTFAANPDMIKQNMLDYLSSIYYFVVGADGRTIKYWAKYTGCIPTNIPYSSIGYQKGATDTVQYDIQFTYTFKEDMDPRILEDFNMLSLRLVTPLMVSNFDSVNSQVETLEENGYISYTTNNKLLTKNILFSEDFKSTIDDPDRDPIIFYETYGESDTVSGKRNSAYVLSFSENTLKNTLFNSMTESSAFDYSELIDKLK